MQLVYQVPCFLSPSSGTLCIHTHTPMPIAIMKGTLDVWVGSQYGWGKLFSSCSPLPLACHRIWIWETCTGLFTSWSYSYLMSDGPPPSGSSCGDPFCFIFSLRIYETHQIMPLLCLICEHFILILAVNIFSGSLHLFSELSSVVSMPKS